MTEYSGVITQEEAIKCKNLNCPSYDSLTHKIMDRDIKRCTPKIFMEGEPRVIVNGGKTRWIARDFSERGKIPTNCILVYDKL